MCSINWKNKIIWKAKYETRSQTYKINHVSWSSVSWNILRFENCCCNNHGPCLSMLHCKSLPYHTVGPVILGIISLSRPNRSERSINYYLSLESLNCIRLGSADPASAINKSTHFPDPHPMTLLASSYCSDIIFLSKMIQRSLCFLAVINPTDKKRFGGKPCQELKDGTWR